MNGLPTSLGTTLNKAGSAAYVNNPSESWANSPIDAGYKGMTLLTGNSYNLPGTSTATNQSNTNANRPVQSADGSWVNPATGAPWHGSYQNPNGTTQYFSNGKQVSDVGQIGVQLPQIAVQKIEKNPAISGQVSQAVDQNAANTVRLGKSFNDYLNEAGGVTKALSASLPAAMDSVNPSGTINRMNADVSNASGKLDSTLNNLTAEQRRNQANIAAANEGYANNQTAALTNLKSDLTSENANYATAAQDVARQAYANAAKQIGLYHLTSGTPTSNSGALDNRYIGAYSAINVPLQQDLANRAIGTTNQIYGLGSNLQNQYLSNLQSQYAGVGALNSDLASRANANNQYVTGLDQSTAQYIQGLRQQVATMQPQIALSYLQAMGIPIQTAQSIISGNTSNLAGLTSLDQSANFYNLNTPYQNNAPTFSSPNVYLPRGGQSYSGGSGGLTGLLDQQNQIVANQNANQSAWLSTPQGKAWMAANAPQANTYSAPMTPTPTYTNPAGGGQYWQNTNGPALVDGMGLPLMASANTYTPSY